MDSGFGLFYVLGCYAAAVFVPPKAAVVWLIQTLLGVRALSKNLEKVMEPKVASRGWTMVRPVLTYVLSIAFSWLTVLAEVVTLGVFLFGALRAVLTPPPQAVRDIRYTLSSNPNLPRESVWARFYALIAISGQIVPSSEGALESLDQVGGWYDDFNKRGAVQHLRGLRLIDATVITEIENVLNDRDAYRRASAS